jgi:hypothetical protein
MKTFQQYLTEEDCTIYTNKQLTDLEKFADNLLDKWGIDIEFTKHFGDRMSDNRNTPCIKLAELQQLMKKIDKDKGKKIKSHDEGEAVLVDLQKDLNLPFVIDIDKDGEFTLTLKTIMRKKDFKTPDEKIVY